MKCGSCQKKMSRIRWYAGKILPFMISYSLSTRNETGQISKPVPLCKQCGKFYRVVEQLVQTVGEERALEILKGASEEDGM